MYLNSKCIYTILDHWQIPEYKKNIPNPFENTLAYLQKHWEKKSWK